MSFASQGHAPHDIASEETPEFTAIVTCYFEEKSIHEFHSRLSTALKSTGRTFEIIMINDGSTDGTLTALNGIFEADTSVTAVIDFFRNFGQAAAITAGLCAASGRHIILMDSDLQLDPEQLPLLIERFDAGHDSVNGFRKNRNDPWPRRIASRVAALILSRAAQKPVKDFGCTFRVIHGNLVRGLNFGPHKLFNQGELLSKTGRWSEVEVHHHSRRYGKSGWTLRKLFDFYMENLLNVSNRPFQLVAMAVLGLVALFSLRVAIGFLADFSILPVVTNGLILNVVLISTLTVLVVLAVIGEFSIRAYRALQQSPQYIIRSARIRKPAVTSRAVNPVDKPLRLSG